MNNNFFHLFEQAVSFDIDQTALDKQLHQLQKQYHPDNISNSNEQAQYQAQNRAQYQSQSALINHAYQTLKYPDNRASHLLELSGQIVNLDNSIADLDFLDDAMEIRMALDDFADAQHAEKLTQLKTQLQHRIERQAESFKQAYQSQNWQSAIDATQKLKFLAKIDKDIDKALDELASIDEDDDLYV